MWKWSVFKPGFNWHGCALKMQQCKATVIAKVSSKYNTFLHINEFDYFASFIEIYFVWYWLHWFKNMKDIWKFVFFCFRTYRGLFSRVSSSCKLSQKYKHEYSSTDINISLFQWDVGIRQETESIGLHRRLTGIKRDEMRTRSRPVSCWQEEEWWRRLNFWPAAGSEYIPAGFFFYVHFLFESSHATYLLWWGTPAICPLMIPHVSRSNLALIPTNPSAQTQTGAKGVYV